MEIKIKELKKSYGETTVLNGINMNFEAGKFYGLLGPNGAGKTTLFNLLINAVKKTSGEVEWLLDDRVVDSKDVNQHIGVVFQQNNLDDFLTVEENLIVRGSLYGMNKQEIKESLETINGYLDIKELLKKRYKVLSGGQKRKCDIARALIHNPSILLLDEPTTALDPQSRSDLWQAINFLNKTNGMTIILISHYLDELESCDVLYVLTKGEVRYSGQINDFIGANSRTVLRLQVKDYKLLENLEVIDGRDVSFQKDEVLIEGLQMNEILDLLTAYHQKGWIKDFQVEKSSLERAYLNLLNSFERKDIKNDSISY